MIPDRLSMMGINASVGTKVIFEDFDCSILLSGTTTIIGPGGSGKSTLLKILDNHFCGTQYGIFFGGTITANISGCEFLPQKKTVEFSFSSEEIIKGKSFWAFSDDALTYIETCFSTKNLDATQRRILALTRLLCSDPDLLLLDEPIFGMPEDIRNWVSQLLFFEKTKRTILIVTHNISFARKISDFVIMMMDGVILEEGEAANILSQPTNEIARSIVNGGLF